MGEVTRDLERARDILRREISRAERIVVLTGAGISTDSGVADFRSPGSPWKKYPPIDFATFRSSAEARAEAWRRKFAIDDTHAGARPNSSHTALARLVSAGKITCLITQNIDGFHQASGVPMASLVELHGNGTYATCLECGQVYGLDLIRQEFEKSGVAPECRCGGIVKSATVAFGQPMPRDEVGRALKAALHCDLFVAMGSSLVVYPAASLPIAAKQAASRLIIINREPTPLDRHADFVLLGELGPILSGLDDPVECSE